MAKLTPQNQAELVKDLITYDLNRMGWSDDDKLDYLKVVGDFVDEKGEDILAYDPPVGEDRPENEDSDISLADKMAVLNALFEVRSARRGDVLNPVQFISEGDCLTGPQATEWLYREKYTTESDHIHIMPEGLCLNMASNPPQWLEPDGVRDEGSIWYLFVEMYEEYKRRHNARDNKHSTQAK